MALNSTPTGEPRQGAAVDFDVERARRDTPGAGGVAHLNNAGAALPPAQVTEAVITHIRREAEMGGYEAAAAAADQVEHTYAAIARLIGCEADEVAVVENAFTIDKIPAQRIQQHLSAHGVNVSVSVVDHARLDLPHRGLPDLVRASVHYYNTEDELDRLISALPRI